MAAPLLAFIVFQVIIKMHQYTVHERMEAQNLVSMVIPESQFRWHKTGKEILVHNRHFDIKELRKVGDQYYVTGVFDSKEDKLKQQMASAMRHASASSWIPADAMFLVFFSDAHFFRFPPPIMVPLQKLSPLFCDDYTSISPEPLSPPPIPG
jgi:hypothetical protein